MPPKRKRAKRKRKGHKSVRLGNRKRAPKVSLARRRRAKSRAVKLRKLRKQMRARIKAIDKGMAKNDAEFAAMRKKAKRLFRRLRRFQQAVVSRISALALSKKLKFRKISAKTRGSLQKAVREYGRGVRCRMTSAGARIFTKGGKRLYRLAPGEANRKRRKDGRKRRSAVLCDPVKLARARLQFGRVGAVMAKVVNAQVTQAKALVGKQKALAKKAVAVKKVARKAGISIGSIVTAKVLTKRAVKRFQQAKKDRTKAKKSIEKKKVQAQKAAKPPRRSGRKRKPAKFASGMVSTGKKKRKSGSKRKKGKKRKAL